MKYFEILMDLKPEIMIVPLEDNKFNRGKSNIAWIEGTVAGASIITNDLPEFQMGLCLRCEPSSLFSNKAFNFFIDDARLILEAYITSVERLPLLSKVNKLRKDVLEHLMRLEPKFSTKNVEPLKPATDKEFFNHCLTHDYTQENKSYREIHENAFKYLMGKVNPKSAVEFGCGSGYYLELFNNNGIPAHGLELNSEFIEYFKKRNPDLAEYIHQCNFVTEPLELDQTVDLGISIEVFEHIKLEESEWDLFISKLSSNFRYFYFSSTPFRDKPRWDSYWGHINIRTTTNWIKLFERNGWELVEKPKVLTGWDILFISKNV